LSSKKNTIYAEAAPERKNLPGGRPARFGRERGAVFSLYILLRAVI
jgi:hypothetical protein